MDEDAYRPASELVRALAAREVSSRELLELYLDRVDRSPLNAVITLDPEGARAAAGAADDALVRGASPGRLHGLPMTVKDVFETAGMRTTAGFPGLADHVPTRDADAVARLRAAGAVVFGKTNMPVMAMDWQSYNPLFGVTDNPWDPSRTPGGSSGGSAVAVAAGLTGLELGSDIRGSLRVPAHFCGVFTLKPTFGLVPTRGHVPGPPGSLSGADMGVVGPLGRSADDLDLALDVLAGPDSASAVAWQLRLPAARGATLRDYRIAVWIDDPYCPVDGAALAVLREAVEALRREGACLDERARPVDLAEAHRLYERLFEAAVSPGLPDETFAALSAAASAPPAGNESWALVQARAATASHRDWLRLHEQRLQLGARWADFFRSFDVLLCPVTPTAATPHDHSEDLAARTITVNGSERSVLEQSVWPSLAGAAYVPAAVVPVGRTQQGLPVGMHVVAPHLQDRTAIDVARRIAQVVGGYERPRPDPTAASHRTQQDSRAGRAEVVRTYGPAERDRAGRDRCRQGRRGPTWCRSCSRRCAPAPGTRSSRRWR